MGTGMGTSTSTGVSISEKIALQERMLMTDPSGYQEMMMSRRRAEAAAAKRRGGGGGRKGRRDKGHGSSNVVGKLSPIDASSVKKKRATPGRKGGGGGGGLDLEAVLSESNPVKAKRMGRKVLNDRPSAYEMSMSGAKNVYV